MILILNNINHIDINNSNLNNTTNINNNNHDNNHINNGGRYRWLILVATQNTNISYAIYKITYFTWNNTYLTYTNTYFIYFRLHIKYIILYEYYIYIAIIFIAYWLPIDICLPLLKASQGDPLASSCRTGFGQPPPRSF